MPESTPVQPEDSSQTTTRSLLERFFNKVQGISDPEKRQKVVESLGQLKQELSVA